MPARLVDAQTDFQELVRLSSADPCLRAKAPLQLGRVCVKLNDLAKAERHFQEALNIDREANVFTPSERSEIQDIVPRKVPPASLP